VPNPNGTLSALLSCFQNSSRRESFMRPHPPFMVLAASPLRRNVCIEPSKSCLRSTGAPVELISFSEASDL
jgi:hypothetical protein